MKISLVQYNPVWESKEENKKKIIELIERDFVKSSLLIFPEMTLTGFTMMSEKFSESLNGDSYKFFSGIAKKSNTFVAAGLIENDYGNYFNTLILLNPGGEVISKYRKIHPFAYSTEDKHYKKGEEVQTAEINGLKSGLSICYDLRFPELFRFYAKKRVHLIIVIANWPDTRIEHWRTLLKARAIENQCYVAGVNRVGDDPELHYTGYSSIYDPMGNEIISLINEEKIIFADISKENVTKIRTNLPFLDDINLI
ncbi:MAG: nitrilase-related carbon-nitrogen hydrolase [Ignavibacteriaceae bacterium]